MNLESMSKEELIDHINNTNEFMDNVVVFWGGKKEFRQTMEEVRQNESGEYTKEETQNAKTILETDGAFDEFIALLQDSFEHGGINYMISEKLSAIMAEAASRHSK
ncbi:hypothetical protein ACFL2Q_05600 [Thermodesulfobacteriota bacterium]